MSSFLYSLSSTNEDCMSPLIKSGDTVKIKKCKISEIQENDLVRIKKFDNFVIHRVIYKTDSAIVTKGDHDIQADGYISSKQITGKVVSITRNNKQFNSEDIYLLQSTIYFKEIIKLNRLLTKNSISFVYLKGLPLHLYYASTLPKRIYADCDLLVEETAFDKVRQLLITNGFTEDINHISQTQSAINQYLSETTFSKNVQGVRVSFDIHLQAVFLMTQLGNLEAIYPQKLLKQFTRTLLKTKEVITIQKHHLPILRKDYAIIYLALHFLHHNFQGIHRISLLTIILNHPSISRETLSYVKRISNNYQLTNFLFPTWYILNKYYPTEVTKQLLLDKSYHSSFIKKKLQIFISKINIFNDEDRVNGGVNRFLLILLLSPQPWYKRLLIIFNYQVIFSFFLVIKFKVYHVFTGSKVPISFSSL